MEGSLLFSIGQLLIGFVLLVFSGDKLVTGGVNIAQHFKISTLVVGLTVVAFGTSAPELIVSLKAALSGHPEICIGNVVGSNIANMALVLGLTAIILILPVQKASIKIDWPVMMLSFLAFFAAIINGSVNYWEGWLMVLALLIFVVYSIRKSQKAHIGENVVPPSISLTKALFLVIIASIGLAFGADFLVKGSSEIALRWGVSERVISITIVAFGTSVPELTASLVAALKKETDISIGNIIGSNIFNILAVIGTTATIKSIPVPIEKFRYDIYWMLGFSLLLLLFIFPLKKNLKAFEASNFKKWGVLLNFKGGRLTRWEGAIMVLLYLFYIITLFY